jgi:hypothetical protein
LNDWPRSVEKIAAKHESNCNEQGQILRAIMKRFNKQLPLLFHWSSIMGSPLIEMENELKQALAQPASAGRLAS